MRAGLVYYGAKLAGEIFENNDGEYVFQYDPQYVEQHPDQFVTFSMPVREAPYKDKRLFPFFDGLIPEGWLLEIASKSWKIQQNDRMGLLLACCKNCIGAVSVVPSSNSDE